MKKIGMSQLISPRSMNQVKLAPLGGGSPGVKQLTEKREKAILEKFGKIDKVMGLRDEKVTLSDLQQQKEKVYDGEEKVPNLYNFRVEPLEKYDFVGEGSESPSELLKNGGDAWSQWVSSEGVITWRKCRALEYEEKLMKFKIEWIEPALNSTQRYKYVTRLNLMFEGEDFDAFLRRRAKAVVHRYKHLYVEDLERKALPQHQCG